MITFAQFLRLYNMYSFWNGSRHLDYWEVYHSKYPITDIMEGRTPITVRYEPIELMDTSIYAMIKSFKNV